MEAYYLLNGWYGQSKHPVKIVGEPPQKYHCQLLEEGPLGGRNRWGKAGEIVLIPKSAVRKPNKANAGDARSSASPAR